MSNYVAAENLRFYIWDREDLDILSRRLRKNPEA